jgi:hypothetical protein
MDFFASSGVAARSPRLLAACALLSMGAGGCTRTVQLWPPPLNAGDPVVVRFSESRAVSFQAEPGRDSVVEVRELRGRVVAHHGDTLVVRVAREVSGTVENDRAGRSATVVMDSRTTVTRSEVNGWKVGYGILAGAVLIFAGLVMSGP